MDKRQHDLQLIRRWQAGDDKAGHQLVDENQQAILGYIWKISHGKFDNQEQIVDEIYQEALGRAFAQTEGFNGTSTFATWVCGICRNCFFEKVRELTRHSNYTELTDENVENAEFNDDNYYGNPELRYIRKEQKNELSKKIQQTMASLKPEYRDIIISRILEGKKYEDIQKLTGKSIAALESLYRRAVQAFRDEYQRKNCIRRNTGIKIIK